MKYKSKNHSKYFIMYHLIFVCKYRKKLLVKFGEELKDMIYYISGIDYVEGDIGDCIVSLELYNKIEEWIENVQIVRGSK